MSHQAGSNPNSGCGTWALPFSGLNFTFLLLKVGLGPTPQGVARISRGLAPGTCRLLSQFLCLTRANSDTLPACLGCGDPQLSPRAPRGWGKVLRGPRPCGDRGGSSSMLCTTAYRAACGDHTTAGHWRDSGEKRDSPRVSQASLHPLHNCAGMAPLGSPSSRSRHGQPHSWPGCPVPLEKLDSLAAWVATGGNRGGAQMTSKSMTVDT